MKEKTMFEEMRKSGSSIPDKVEYLQANGWQSYQNHDNWVKKSWTKERKDKSLFDLHAACLQCLIDSNELKDAVDTICVALMEDKSEGSYYYSWQANIAMSFYDAVRNHLDKKNNGNLFDESFGDGALHEVSNNAAKNFLDMLCRPLTQTIPSVSNIVQNTEEK